MKKLLLLVLLFSAIVLSTPAAAQDSTGFKIIVNSANPLEELPSEMVSKMFLRKEIWWPDSTKLFVAPIDQPETRKVRKQFSNAIHQQSVSVIQSFWRVMVLSGKDVPPDVLPADSLIVHYVGQAAGGIGYVASDVPLSDDVKELKIIYDQLVKNEEEK